MNKECDNCFGKGYNVVICVHCGGSGEGQYDSTKCFWCGGKGSGHKDCDVCDGSGQLGEEDETGYVTL